MNLYVVFLLACIICNQPKYFLNHWHSPSAKRAEKLVKIPSRVARIYVSISDRQDSYGFLTCLTIGPIPMCDSWMQARHVKIQRRKSQTKD